jgi:hypothetical protein
VSTNSRMDTRCDESVDGENFGAGILSVDSRGRSFWCLGHRQLVVAEALAPGASVAAVSRWYGSSGPRPVGRTSGGCRARSRSREATNRSALFPSQSWRHCCNSPGPRKKREAGKRSSLLAFGLPSCWAVRAAGIRIPRRACGQSALALPWTDPFHTAGGTEVDLRPFGRSIGKESPVTR